MNQIINKISAEKVDDFDYEFFWDLLDRIRHKNTEKTEPKNRLVIIKPLPRAYQDEHILNFDNDELEAYREFISSYIEHRDYGLLKGINEKEYKLKLKIYKDNHNERQITIKEAGFQDKFYKPSYRPKPQFEEIDGAIVDVSPYNTHDYAKQHPEPEIDKAGYRMKKLKEQLKDLLLTFTCISNMSQVNYEHLKERILNLYDEIQEMQFKRQQRDRRKLKAQILVET